MTVCCTAFDTRLLTTCTMRVRSAFTQAAAPWSPHLSAGRDAGGGERAQGLVDRGKHVDRATLQRNLPRNGAPHVQQVLDDAAQVRRLSRDHVLGELPLRTVRPRALQQVDRVRDRGQRIAQLVAEHREKLVLRPARLGDLGERLLEIRGARGGTRFEQ